MEWCLCSCPVPRLAAARQVAVHRTLHCQPAHVQGAARLHVQQVQNATKVQQARRAISCAHGNSESVAPQLDELSLLPAWDRRGRLLCRKRYASAAATAVAGVC